MHPGDIDCDEGCSDFSEIRLIGVTIDLDMKSVIAVKNRVKKAM